MQELAEYFLNDPEEFDKKFQELLDRTPKDRAPGHAIFWIEYFRSVALAIQNTELGGRLGVEKMCFSAPSKSNSKYQILKLAFKTNTGEESKAVLRSVSIARADEMIDKGFFLTNDIEAIEKKCGMNVLSTGGIQSYHFHINSKEFMIYLTDREANETTDAGTSQTDAQEAMQVVNPLQLSEDQQGQFKIFDTHMDLISNPATASEENIQAFFSNSIKLYNDNKGEDLTDSEAAKHGFMYGLFTAFYKNKYGLNVGVEESAGKGFLDIAVTFHKMHDQNQIIDTDAGSSIIYRTQKRE